MDEEDIAVPSGSLNNRLRVVYGGESVGKRRVETVRKFGYGDSQCEAILGVSHREKPYPLPRITPVNYNWAAIKMESIKNAAASMQGFESYDTRLKRWYQRYESYLREDAAFKDRERRTITLNLILTNHGTCPAEDIHLTFHFPDGFDVYDEESQPEPPKEPAPPSSGYSSASLFPSIVRAEMPLPRFDNPHAPKIRKTNSYEVTYHRDRLKHDFEYPCRPLYLAFDSFEATQSFSFSYSIHAGNAPLSQEGELHVIIDKQTNGNDYLNGGVQ